MLSHKCPSLLACIQYISQCTSFHGVLLKVDKASHHAAELSSEAITKADKAFTGQLTFHQLVSRKVLVAYYYISHHLL